MTDYDWEMQEIKYENDMAAIDLEFENAKLRDQLEEQKCFAADLKKDVRALRELVRDMWDFFCVVPDDEPHIYKEELDFSVEVWKRMRKLGVKVE